MFNFVCINNNENRWLYIEVLFETNEDKLQIDYSGVAISVVALLIALGLGLSVSYYQYHEFPSFFQFNKILTDEQIEKINCCQRAQKIIAIFGALGLVIALFGTIYNNVTSEYPFYSYDARYWVGIFTLTVCASPYCNIYTWHCCFFFVFFLICF